MTRDLLLMLSVFFLVSSVPARAVEGGCGDPRLKASRRLLETRIRTARLRVAAHADRVRDLEPLLADAEDVAFASQALLVASGALLGGAGVALRLGPAMATGGVGAVDSLFGGLALIFRTVAITTGVVGGAGTAASLGTILTSLPDGTEPVGTAYGDSGIAFVPLGEPIRLERFYQERFTKLHDAVATASADLQRELGERWYALGRDDVEAVATMIAEAKAHRELYQAEIKLAEGMLEELAVACPPARHSHCR